MPPRRNQLLNFTFEVDGVKQIDVALGAMAAAVNDLGFLWPVIRTFLLPGFKKQFDSEGRAGSGGWARLAMAYAAWKSRRFPGKKILERTGRLRASLTKSSHPDFIFKKSKLSMVIGTKVPYARFHQRGTRQMRSRKPIELTALQKRVIPKMIHEAIVKSGQFVRASR